MAKKIKIDIDFTRDNAIISVSCHKKDYWLAYQLQKQLNLNFKRINDLTFFHAKLDMSLDYPLFFCENKDLQVAVYLVSNFNPDGKLFSDHGNSDYFLLIHGFYNREIIEHMVKEIKKIPGVLLAYETKLNKIKELDNFLSDLEIHMVEYLKT